MVRYIRKKILLEEKLIDLERLEVRPKVTEKDLDNHYESFLSCAPQIRDCFVEKEAFDKVLKDISYDKRPKLIPRDLKYPFMMGFRTSFQPYLFLKPNERRLNDDYFTTAHCLVSIPKKTSAKDGLTDEKESEDKKESVDPLDNVLREEITEKFKKFPGYEGILEIPSDGTCSETKHLMFHESLHYLIIRYHTETGRDFLNPDLKKNYSEKELYQFEHLIHERTVEVLTDKLLIGDPEAQFEERWLHYSINNSFSLLTGTLSSVATGLIVGFSISNPALLPAAFIPQIFKNYLTQSYKNKSKKELLTDVDYPTFNI